MNTMSSVDVMSSSPRRHLLSPKTVRCGFGVGKVQTCYSSVNVNVNANVNAKRPSNDENHDPVRTNPSSYKRTKSILGNSTNTFAWHDRKSLSADENAVLSSGKLAVIDNKGPSSIASVADSLASSASSKKSSANPPSDSPLKTGKRSYNESFELSKPLASSKPRISSPLKKSLRYSPPRKSPSRSRKRNFSRIDPPPSLCSRSSTSIDEILRCTSPSWSFDQGYSHSSDESEGGVSLIVTALDRDFTMPDSWNFSIYEDTPEETLQNLMEHSTGNLDISDESDDDLQMDEILLKGKENIPPARLQDLVVENQAVEATAYGVPPAPTINQQRTTTEALGKIMKGHREVLGGLRVEDFYPPEDKLATMKNFVPIIKKAKLDIFTGYPTGLKLGNFRDKAETRIEIWESESAKEESEDESEDGGVRLRSRACSPVKHMTKQSCDL